MSFLCFWGGICILCPCLKVSKRITLIGWPSQVLVLQVMHTENTVLCLMWLLLLTVNTVRMYAACDALDSYFEFETITLEMWLMNGNDPLDVCYSLFQMFHFVDPYCTGRS